MKLIISALFMVSLPSLTSWLAMSSLGMSLSLIVLDQEQSQPQNSFFPRVPPLFSSELSPDFFQSMLSCISRSPLPIQSQIYKRATRLSTHFPTFGLDGLQQAQLFTENQVHALGIFFVELQFDCLYGLPEVQAAGKDDLAPIFFLGKQVLGQRHAFKREI